MKIEILSKEGNHLRFLIKDINTSFANAVRRTIMTEVPVMAIDDVVIVENTSVMFDEVLAHRLGFVPIKTDLESYVLPEECDCQSELGCNKCRASLTLEAESVEGRRTVLSGELMPQDPTIKPVSDEIPILELGAGQKIRLEAYVRLGKGQSHAKWQPTSLCSHKYLPKVTISSNDCKRCEECIKYCPYDVYDKEGSKIIVKNELNCTLCMECVRHCPEEKGLIEISWDENSFIFNIESTGALEPQTLTLEAVKILNRKVGEFEEQIDLGKKR